MSANLAELASASERFGAATRPNLISCKIFVQVSPEGIRVETRTFVRSADPILID